MDYKKTLGLSLSLLLSSFFVIAEPENQPETATDASQDTSEVQNEEQTDDTTTSVESVEPYNLYVTDNLFVFLHSGGSNRYRIIGRIAASEEVKIIAKDTETGWLQVELSNGRQGWVDNSVLVESAGSKAELAKAQSEVANLTQKLSELDNGSEETIENLNLEVTNLQQSNQQLQSQVEELATKNAELENSIVQADQTQKILDKLYDVGAVLLGVFFGWLITRRRKSGLSFDRL